MFSRRAALKFKRNVETFKYLYLWQPFPLRFSCWTFSHMLVFISSSQYCARNIKWQLFSSERVSSAKTFHSSQGPLYSNRGVDNYKKSAVQSIRGPLSGEEKDGDNPVNPKTVTQSSSLFSPKTLASSLTLSKTTNVATINLNRERWGLTKCSLRGTKSPTEPFVFL